MNKFTADFLKTKKVIGMIHVNALPGTPNNKYSISSIIVKAIQEAELYEACGLDAVILENMHDVPYLNREVGPEITAAMTAITTRVKSKVSIPCGVQILAGANLEALAVANASECDFIRVEGFVYSHIADEGLMNACAGELMRVRKYIDAENVAVFADIKKKHSSHSITGDLDLRDFADACHFFQADSVIVSGSSTAKEANLEELQDLWKTTKLPVLIGSGITAENISKYWDFANGFIIGSYFKKGGKWQNTVLEENVVNLMNKIKSLRSLNIDC
ncbi:MAG: BtpA/SgcQ family protein [Candidatus Cloacimonetes bacterium]|nr:BtpA/SgcQ family protein [Candidatus Cloacimonadota bacterium]